MSPASNQAPGGAAAPSAPALPAGPKHMSATFAALDGEPPPWRHRWVLYLAGTGAAAFGASRIAADTHGWTPPGDIARWLFAGVVVHDLLVAPATLAAAALVRRLVPAAYRRLVQAGLAVSAVLVLVALPQLRGYGRRPDNPSVQPRDYTRGLLVALAVIWGVVAALAAVRHLSRRIRASREIW